MIAIQLLIVRRDEKNLDLSCGCGSDDKFSRLPNKQQTKQKIGMTKIDH